METILKGERCLEPPPPVPAIPAQSRSSQQGIFSGDLGFINDRASLSNNNNYAAEDESLGGMCVLS